MNSTNLRIWTKSFFKSFIWLILPFSIFGSIRSCNEYEYAGNQLSSYSVNVSGYKREDGTYIQPYKRRLPGSVAHDAPYKRTRFYMGAIFTFSIIAGIGSILFFFFYGLSERDSQRKIIQELERKKYIENRSVVIKTILSNLNFDFSSLYNVPSELKKNYSNQYMPNPLPSKVSRQRCKFCSISISHNVFFISFVAYSKIHNVCLKCIQNQNKIGRNQHSSKYINEMAYFDRYRILLHSFQVKFKNESRFADFPFNDDDIHTIFDETLQDRQRAIRFAQMNYK